MRRILTTSALTAVVLASAWLVNTLIVDLRANRAGDSAIVENAVLDPYDTPLLHDYRRFRDAALGHDFETLASLSEESDSYLAYRAAITLARSPELEPAARLRHYRRAAELRVDDPLARADNRAFYLEYAATAEAAGDSKSAIEAYAQALPEEIAVEAVARLESNPFKLANIYFSNRLYSRALDALGDLGAPSIEAPSLRSLGRHEEALDAYQRWLDEQPTNTDALYGRAWSHFYLGNLDQAYSYFEDLSGSSSLYGRALIERRRNNLWAAVELMKQTGEPSWLWLTTGWLEAQNEYEAALPVYLTLAQGNSSYADDSAYRAYVLASRLDKPDIAAVAREAIPDGSFFDLRLGGEPVLPAANDLPVVELEAIERAWALARASNMEAATGELVFALRDEEDEAAAVTIAEALQLLGEFRQSQRAAQQFVNAGSVQLRTWQAAYPRAFEELVLPAAARNDLEPELLWAVMRQESAFYPKAVSVSNAAGLMQVVPSTWDWLAELQGEEPGDRFDPADNIRYGSYYLRWLMNYHDGDRELVVPSYNRGQGYIRRLFESDYVAGDKADFFREIDALETREYLQRVMVNYRTYHELYPEDSLADSGGSETEQMD